MHAKIFRSYTSPTFSRLFMSKQRLYTDYTRMKYPELTGYSYGFPIFWGVLWLFFMRCGHINTFTGRNEWKKHIYDRLDRYDGIYEKGDEWETVESFFTNLPDRAE